MFVSKRGKLSGGRRKLSNLDLYNLYSSPDIFRVIKSRWMIMTQHSFRRWREYIYLGNYTEETTLGYLDADGKLISK
jgi:hypothetical protein